MRLIISSSMMAVGMIACGAVAEPVVVRNTPGNPSSTFNLTDINPLSPNLSFALDPRSPGGGDNSIELRPVVIENGTQCFGAFPGNLFPEVANIGYFNSAAGMVVDAATGGWVYTEPLCDVGSVMGIVKTRVGGDFDCEPGCVFESSFLADDGVLYIPFRWHLDGETDWFYGWSAFQIIEEVLDDCVSQCKPLSSPMSVMHFEWIGVGYETEANTGIVVGGGLCPADLNFDALLNFSDISEFLSLYSAGDLGADMNNDGDLNFLDVSVMIGMFGGGCGL